MNWNHDISAAPRDGTHVILATEERKVIRSYWMEPKHEPAHWCMLSHKNKPVAWMLWPKHPFDLRDGAQELLGGFPVAAAETNAEETGVLASTRQGASVECSTGQGMTAGETATQFILEDAGSGA